MTPAADPFATAATGVVAATVLLVTVLRLVLSRRDPTMDAHARRTADDLGLPLDDAMRAALAGRLAVRERWGAVGAFVVGGATAVAVLTAAPGDLVLGQPTMRDLAVALGYLVGQALGLGGLAWRESRRPVAQGPRVARTAVPTVADYVPSWERRAARGIVLGGALILVAVAATGDPGLPAASVAVGVGLPVLLLVAVELGARRFVAARQVAGSPLELAWDDALRARTVRDLVGMVAGTGAYAPMLVAAGGEAPGTPLAALLLVPVLLWGTVLLLSGVRGARSHFRRRLWAGQPVAGEVR